MLSSWLVFQVQIDEANIASRIVGSTSEVRRSWGALHAWPKLSGTTMPSSSQHARHSPARVLESTPLSFSLEMQASATEQKISAAVTRPLLEHATCLAAQFFWIKALCTTLRRVVRACLSNPASETLKVPPSARIRGFNTVPFKSRMHGWRPWQARCKRQHRQRPQSS